MRRPTARAIVLVGAVLVGSALAAGCGAGEPRVTNEVPPPATGAARATLVVLGGDETADPPGSGSLTRAWTQRVYAAMPGPAVLVDLSERRSTARAVLRDQLPRAETLHPTVVALWLGLADAEIGTPPAVFEAQVGDVVTGLRRAGTRRVLLLSRRAPPGVEPSGSARYAAALDHVVTADPGAAVTVRLPERAPSQAVVAAAVRPLLPR